MKVLKKHTFWAALFAVLSIGASSSIGAEMPYWTGQATQQEEATVAVERGLLSEEACKNAGFPDITCEASTTLQEATNNPASANKVARGTPIDGAQVVQTSLRPAITNPVANFFGLFRQDEPALQASKPTLGFEMSVSPPEDYDIPEAFSRLTFVQDTHDAFATIPLPRPRPTEAPELAAISTPHVPHATQPTTVRVAETTSWGPAINRGIATAPQGTQSINRVVTATTPPRDGQPTRETLRKCAALPVDGLSLDQLSQLWEDNGCFASPVQAPLARAQTPTQSCNSCSGKVTFARNVTVTGEYVTLGSILGQ